MPSLVYRNGNAAGSPRQLVFQVYKFIIGKALRAQWAGIIITPEDVSIFPANPKGAIAGWAPLHPSHAR